MVVPLQYSGIWFVEWLVVTSILERPYYHAKQLHISEDCNLNIFLIETVIPSTRLRPENLWK
jgi:hypothetical protein